MTQLNKELLTIINKIYDKVEKKNKDDSVTVWFITRVADKRLKATIEIERKGNFKG